MLNTAAIDTFILVQSFQDHECRLKKRLNDDYLRSKNKK